MKSTKIGRGRRASYAKLITAHSKGNDEAKREAIRDKREKRNRKEKNNEAEEIFIEGLCRSLCGVCRKDFKGRIRCL